ncbi:hypothetical protein H5410_016036 [Solanum commersonii]|uniref:Uncharacterized protein n=1 Tax=Solanum commersonii TaxID=4109 RepID=A0A9J5ZW58_SOLCO|nr:hypothetical protein H5410_016036 [Solanum commersonii]
MGRRDREEDVRLGANKYSERQAIGIAAQSQDKDYKEPPPAPLFEPGELMSWSLYRAGIAEFVATFFFLYITVLTVMGVSKRHCLGFWWHDLCLSLLYCRHFRLLLDQIINTIRIFVPKY